MIPLHEPKRVCTGHEFVPTGTYFFFKKCHEKRLEHVTKRYHYTCSVCERDGTSDVYGRYGMCRECQHIYDFTPWDNGTF